MQRLHEESFTLLQHTVDVFQIRVGFALFQQDADGAVEELCVRTVFDSVEADLS